MRFLAFRQSVCTASALYTCPLGRIATMCVHSLNGLKSTGQWYLPARARGGGARGRRVGRRGRAGARGGARPSPSALRWKVSLVSCLAASGSPVSGCRLYFARKGMMLSRSKTAPSGAQTGCSNGVNESAQQSKGRLLTCEMRDSFLPPHSTAHSLAVRCIGAFECWPFPMARETWPPPCRPRPSRGKSKIARGRPSPPTAPGVTARCELRAEAGEWGGAHALRGPCTA